MQISSARQRHSVRRRLSLLAALILAVSLGLCVGIAYSVVRWSGERDLDAALAREENRYMESLEQRLATRAPEPLEATHIYEASQRYLTLNPGNPDYLTIIRVDGAAPLSDRRGPAELLRLRAEGGLPLNGSARIATLETREGPIRSLVVPIRVGRQDFGTLQVAAPLARVIERSNQALLPMALVAVGGVLLGSVLLALMIYRTLAPLGQLAAAARAVDLDDLGRRVPEPRRADEVGSLSHDFNRMLDRLEDAARSRQEFLAAASHELRTPITIARGHLDMLARLRRDDPPLIETVQIVEDEMRHIGRLVEDLLALARSATDDFVITRPMSVANLFAELRLRLAGLGASDVRLEECPDVAIDADPQRLGQAVLNLVINAKRHTPQGTVVRVAARVDRGEVLIAVSDDGPGIDPSLAERVFEPFVKGADSVSDSVGLGLAVVRAIARAHGGTVAMVTGPSGTEVTIRLPRRLVR